MSNEDCINDLLRYNGYMYLNSAMLHTLEEQTIYTAIRAIQKQIPKKINNRSVIKNFPISVHGDCPTCGSKNLSSADTDYCNACGQKLDWTDDNLKD